MSRDPRKRAVRAVLQRHYPRLGLLNDAELVRDLVALIPSRISTGLRDRHGREIHLGDRVCYRNAGPYTKEEYWDPEYEVIWDPPSFRLRHVGGGKSGDSLGFKLKHGGANGNLELIKKGDGHAD